MNWLAWLILGNLTGLSVYRIAGVVIDLYFKPVVATNKLDAAQDVDIIDKALGDGWCKNLADHLK